MNKIKKLQQKRIFSAGSVAGVLFAYIIMVILLSLLSPVFFSFSNIMTLARQTVCTVMIAMGMTFIIGMGGIDLSVGSIVALCGIVAATLVKNEYNIIFVIVITLAVGALFGALNGVLVAKLHLADFVATLATMSILRGIVYVYTQAIPIYGLRDDAFLFIGQGMVGQVPFPVILAVIVVAICWYITNRTKFGRYVLSIGSNQDVAHLVGIKIDRIKIITFTLGGVLCAAGSLVLTSRLGSAMHDAGSGYEMDAIASVVIGGTSMSGGTAKIIGSVLGALIMATIQNGLNLLGINTFWHQIVKGCIILLAVTLDTFNQRRAQEG